MQRIKLRAARMLILGTHPLRQVEQRVEASLPRRIAVDLAAGVADDPAEPRGQELGRKRSFHRTLRRLSINLQMWIGLVRSLSHKSTIAEVIRYGFKPLARPVRFPRRENINAGNLMKPGHGNCIKQR